MSGSNDGDARIDRRTVLRGIGAGATLATAAGTGSASRSAQTRAELAKNRAMRRAERAYADRDAMQQALSEYAEPLREQLAAEGISVPLALDAFDSIRTFPDSHDDVPTAHIAAVVEDGSRKVELHVMPQADRAFAIDDGPSVARRFDADGSDPTPAKDCSYSSGCTDDKCQCQAPSENCDNCDRYWEKEYCCLYPDGSYSCDTVEYYCDRDCAPC